MISDSRRAVLSGRQRDPGGHGSTRACGAPLPHERAPSTAEGRVVLQQHLGTARLLSSGRQRS